MTDASSLSLDLFCLLWGLRSVKPTARSDVGCFGMCRIILTLSHDGRWPAQTMAALHRTTPPLQGCHPCARLNGVYCRSVCVRE